MRGEGCAHMRNAISRHPKVAFSQSLGWTYLNKPEQPFYFKGEKEPQRRLDRLPTSTKYLPMNYALSLSL
jgi:hypothetical protein